MRSGSGEDQVRMRIAYLAAVAIDVEFLSQLRPPDHPQAAG